MLDRADEPIAAGGTIARAYPKRAQADAAVARLRAAGFGDVRVSERSGDTAEAHVPPQDGLTEDDFVATLARAGFSAADAERLASAVACGASLVTVSAAQRASAALAVLRGENVEPHHLLPVDAPVDAPGGLESDPAAGDRVIPLRAEQLEVSTEPVTEQARVRREIVTEQKTVTIPVRHEELVIERDA